MSPASPKLLNSTQLAAIKAFEGLAEQALPQANAELQHRLEECGIDKSTYTRFNEALETRAHIAIHFHPDRTCRQGHLTINGLHEDGIFRNQYDTGISSGSPSAYPGGQRDEWEKRIYDGIYHAKNALPPERPKYGALDLLGYIDGPSPRFGSCYFELDPAINARTTFTYLGSQERDSMEKSGSLKNFDRVINAVLKDLLEKKAVLGCENVSATQLISLSERNDQMGRAIDSFIEAQIHGPVRLHEDVVGLVADPAFENTPIASRMRQLCERYELKLRWHHGYRARADSAPEIFRECPARKMALRIARDGILDTQTLGIAAEHALKHPEAWKDIATDNTLIMYFRRLWLWLVLHSEAPAH